MYLVVFLAAVYIMSAFYAALAIPKSEYTKHDDVFENRTWKGLRAFVILCPILNTLAGLSYWHNKEPRYDLLDKAQRQADGEIVRRLYREQAFKADPQMWCYLHDLDYVEGKSFESYLEEIHPQ